MASSDPLSHAEVQNYEVLCDSGDPSPAKNLPEESSSPLRADQTSLSSPCNAIVAMPNTPHSTPNQRRTSPLRTKCKIRENPVLERFVSDMLLRGYSFRDIEKSVRVRLHLTVSRETIRTFYQVVLLPRLTLSPRSKTETRMAILDLEEATEQGITKSEVEMLKSQARALSALEERLLRLHEETEGVISAKLLNTLTRTTVTLIKAQNDLFDQYQKVLNQQKRMELYRQKVLEALHTPLSHVPFPSPHTATDIIKLVDFFMRSLEP